MDWSTTTYPPVSDKETGALSERKGKGLYPIDTVNLIVDTETEVIDRTSWKDRTKTYSAVVCLVVKNALLTPQIEHYNVSAGVAQGSVIIFINLLLNV